MKQCLIQQNSIASLEEMRSSVSDRRDCVVCPKPRRLGLRNTAINGQPPIRSLRLNLSQQAEPSDSKEETDLFDIILPKGGCGGIDMEFLEQSCTQVLASSPPFFCGSPPSRVANPLIHDLRFGDEEITPLSPVLLPPSPSSSSRKGGVGGGGSSSCIRPNFGNKPAVRIEGFDCRDRRNCSIPALA
ncbi:Translocase subunit seca [Melia azedarach]|uniref:Translocase subunit seca n=2 Tax=Melia azedarach TaxID=155640 RepID=A0ACC1XGR5_MELAZ|nr:Translocase subunit seca [Melia azedarach]KAJ4709939.1 Translocase subunit seca [Melia azedarach]